MIRKRTLGELPCSLICLIPLSSMFVVACAKIGEGPDGPTKEVNSAYGDNGGDNGNDGDGNDGDGDSGNGDGATGAPVGGGDDGALTPCREATATAKVTLETYCTACHSATPVNNGLSSILNVDNLVKQGVVVPNSPDDSPLYKRISSNTMPPASVQKRPGAADIDAVHDWIECGAPSFDSPGAGGYAFTSVDARLREMLVDIRSVSNLQERRDIRYIDLHPLANQGYSENQLELYRQALSFLLNSLSTSVRVVAPRPVGADRLLFRIDITDYGWNQATWDAISARFPYQVVYDQNSELFPYDEATAQQLRDEIDDDTTFIFADWFLANASKPPLYHEILNIPSTFAALENQLGVDVFQNIVNEEVDRVGIQQAGPSDANRVFERHELPGNRGGFWVSYDFANNVGDRDIFANPLDFVPDGGEMIFALNNGLHGYYVAAGDPARGGAVRLDQGPIGVVQDPGARDGQVTNGLSCFNCHIDGLIVRDDEVRADALTNGAEDLDAVLALYSPVRETRERFDEDNNRYRSAIAAAGITAMTDKTMHSLHDTHLDGIDMAGVASVLGIETSELERAIDRNVAALAVPREIVALRRDGGTIDRDTLENVFADLVEGIGLGRSVLSQ